MPKLRRSAPLCRGLTPPLVLPLVLALALGACAGRNPPQTPDSSPPASTPSPAPAPAEGTDTEAASEASAEASPIAPPAKPKIDPWTLCAVESGEDESTMEGARRKLQETSCAATLWLDGLFGQEANLANAREVSGRVELLGQHSDYEGGKARARFNVRVKLPNLDRRVDAFLGRDDTDEFVRDRQEGFALQSPFLNVETQERWLAGFGYALPPSDQQKIDFRVGLRIRSDPEVFTQARFRRNLFVDQENAWRWRETAFWTNRDGFGLSSFLDFDHLMSRNLLLRWGTAGTFSESTRGLDWRSAWVLYHNLPGQRAVAYETFIRGATDAEVPLREYGARIIYRQNVFYSWLFGEVIAGYTWPRLYLDEERDGSALVGLNMQLHFGRQLPK